MNKKGSAIIIWVVLIIVVGLAVWLALSKKSEAPQNETKNEKTINVFFLNKQRYAENIEPYEVKVERTVEANKDSKQAVIEELFKGPSAEEKQEGLMMIYSETTGATLQFDASTETARIDLRGECNSGGATYTAANLIFKNLKQFPDVKYVRIYDSEGYTLFPEQGDSTPGCLQP